MKLNEKEIKKLFLGVVEIQEENGWISPRRFTKEAIEFFKITKERRYFRAFSTSGITMEFKTDSEVFSFDYECFQSSAYKTFSIDVYVDGLYTKHFLKNDIESDSGKFSIDLKKGNKKVAIYFSNFFGIKIKNVEISNNSKIMPVKKDKKFLFFGDSITQGYTTPYPSLTYSNIISRAFNAQCINKGIGGDYYYHQFLDEKPISNPDAIIIAFGTNDWSGGKDIEKNSKVFYDKLTKIYPDSKIFALLPLWRGKEGKQNVIAFDEMREILIKVCKNYKNITLIDAIDFVPHDKNFFLPDLLHPNTLGFGIYAENVINAIKPFMD